MGFANLSKLKQLPYGKEHEELLAELHQDNKFIKKGHHIAAGHTRGWGLEFGGLAAAIAEDPIYKESIKLAHNLTVFPESKLMNIFLIMKYGMKNLNGDIIEFGSYRGGSALFMANIARRLNMRGTIYALDTFEGMPTTDPLLDLHSSGDFRDASLDNLLYHIKQAKLYNITPIKGLFQQTIPQLIPRLKNIALAHVDCDIYSAVKYAISVIKYHMKEPGGYIIFDDSLQGSCLGALEATEDMIEELGLRGEQAYPHLVYRFPKLEG